MGDLVPYRNPSSQFDCEVTMVPQSYTFYLCPKYHCENDTYGVALRTIAGYASDLKIETIRIKGVRLNYFMQMHLDSSADSDDTDTERRGDYNFMQAAHSAKKIEDFDEYHLHQQWGDGTLVIPAHSCPNESDFDAIHRQLDDVFGLLGQGDIATAAVYVKKLGLALQKLKNMLYSWYSWRLKLFDERNATVVTALTYTWKGALAFEIFAGGELLLPFVAEGSGMAASTARTVLASGRVGKVVFGTSVELTKLGGKSAYLEFRGKHEEARKLEGEAAGVAAGSVVDGLGDAGLEYLKELGASKVYRAVIKYVAPRELAIASGVTEKKVNKLVDKGDEKMSETDKSDLVKVVEEKYGWVLRMLSTRE